MITPPTSELITPPRRSFLLGMAATGIGFVVSSISTHSEVFMIHPEQTAQSYEPNVWVKIDPDGTTTITVNRAEMGQGVRTSLAMIVADEMDADWSKVKVRQARAGTADAGAPMTGGSGSVSGSYTNLRRIGASIRSVMISAAAKKWGISESSCTASNGVVSEVNGSREISYGGLTDDAAKLTPPSNPALKSVGSFKLIGKRIPRVDNADVVSGKAIYGLDVRIPGMKYAVMVRQIALGASVASFDATEALKIPGVIRIENVPSVGLVVLADNTHAALTAREALKIQWNMGNNTSLNSSGISDKLRAGFTKLGDLPTTSVKIVEAEYHLPYIAHATMEPMNCVADVRDTTAEIWCPTQVGDSALSSVASAIGISANNIKFNVTLLGGGFGRRLSSEYAPIAARISKAFKVPVLFMFTRKDDMQGDQYRPASFHACKGGVDAAGKITGIFHYTANGDNSTYPPYAMPQPRLSSANVSLPVPVGYWRSVGHTSSVFVNECFIDELAITAGKDPYLFRRDMLTNNPRLLAVLNKAAELAEWTKPLPKGWGRGIACTNAYSSVAHVIEVSVSPIGALKVERIIAVVDCGIAVNPMSVEAQMQGAAVDALSTAIKAEITIEKGAVKQSTFIDYEWLRINEMPKIEVHIMPSTSSPSGMGEAGFPSVSPALCNAIFNATGKRVRSLPIQKTSLTSVDAPIDQLAGDMQIFPSPFTTAFTVSGTIKSPASKDITLTIRNLLGTTLVEVPSTLSDNGEFTQAIEFPRATTGVYFLTVRCGAAQFTRKIIKE
jgi:isoquinoline 1-oxidoreductase beta subunit